MHYVLRVSNGCLRLNEFLRCETAKGNVLFWFWVLQNGHFLNCNSEMTLILNVSYTLGRHCSTYSGLFCLDIISIDAYNWYEPSVIRCTWLVEQLRTGGRALPIDAFQQAHLHCKYLLHFSRDQACFWLPADCHKLHRGLHHEEPWSTQAGFLSAETKLEDDGLWPQMSVHSSTPG